MNNHLKKVHELLQTFMIDVERARSNHEKNGGASDGYWNKAYAYIWMYADIEKFHSYRQGPKIESVPGYYQQMAEPVYDQWRDEEKEIFCRGVVIPRPAPKLTLAEYLHDLSFMVSVRNEHRDVFMKSLRCFLEFLRQDTEMDQQGNLEALFPYKMELRKESTDVEERRYILRRVDTAAYPIDIFATAEIFKNLAKACLEGRSNAQGTAAEALGFAWLCLAASAFRVLTRESILFDTPVTALESLKSKNAHTRQISIKSFFGTTTVPISQTLYRFLMALPRDERKDGLFSSPWRSLLRTLQEKGVKPSGRAQKLGRISFLTFMSHPHEAIGYRASNKRSISR